MHKKISILLVICILLVQFPLSVDAEGQVVEKGMYSAMLDSVLDGGGRHWVEETLVDDNWSSNPYNHTAKVIKTHGLAQDVLVNYQQNRLYKFEVDVLWRCYNAGQYSAQWVEEQTELRDQLIERYGSVEEADAFLRELCESVDEKQYESILNDAIKADYITSAGIGLREREGVQKRFEMFQTLLQYNKNFINNATDILGLHDVKEEEEDLQIIKAYVDNYSKAYDAILSTLLTNYKDAYVQSKNPVKTQAIVKAVIGGVAFATAYGAYEDEKINNYTGLESFWEVFEDSFIPKAQSVLKDAGKLNNELNRQLDNLVSRENLLAEGEALSNAIIRSGKQSQDSHYVHAVEDYCNLLLDGYSESAKNWAQFGSLLNNRIPETSLAMVQKWLKSKALEEQRKNIMGQLPGPFEKANTALADLALIRWASNEAVGLEETVKKTYELLYLNHVIENAVATYRQDVKAYQKNPTEAYAQNAINDLKYLRRLRLREETVAYQCASAQIDSVLGVLISNGSEAQYWDDAYQSSIDTLVMTDYQIMPSKTLEFTNCRIALDYSDDYGGLYAIVYDKENRTYRYLPEIQYQLAMGLKLDNVELIVTPVNQSWDSLYLPCLEMNGGSINIKDCSLEIDELTVMGQVDIRLLDENSTLAADRMTAENCTIQSDADGARFENREMEVIGTLTTSNVELTAIEQLSIQDDGLVKNETGPVVAEKLSLASGATINALYVQVTDRLELQGGTLQVPLLLEGSISGTGGTLHTLTLQGNQPQTLSGRLQVNNLIADNTGEAGVTVTGRIDVSESVRDELTRIWGGKNIILQRNCNVLGSVYQSNVTLQNARVQGVSFLSTIYLDGTVTLDRLAVSKAGIANASPSDRATLTLTGQDEGYIGGTANLKNITVQGVQTMRFGGDVHTQNTQWPDGLRVILESKSKQIISGEGFSTQELTVRNSSREGVVFQAPVEVNGVLHIGSETRISGDQLIVNGTVDGNTIHGNIRIKSLENAAPLKISGDVVFADNASITGCDLAIGQSLSLGSGSVTLTGTTIRVEKGISTSGATVNAEEGCTIEAGEYSSLGNWNVQQGSILVHSDAAISTLSGGDVELVVEGDASLNVVRAENVRAAVKGDLAIGGTPVLERLILNGEEPQKVYGSNFSVGILELSNTSAEGVTFHSPVEVTEACQNDSTNIQQGQNLHIPYVENPRSGRIYADELTFTKDGVVESIRSEQKLTVDGCAVTVTGALDAKGAIDLKNGGVLLIKKDTRETDIVITMDQESCLEIQQDAVFNNASVSGGTLKIAGDASVKQMSVEGGTLTLLGDGDFSGTCSFTNLIAAGSGKQTFSGTQIGVENLTVQNVSGAPLAVNCMVKVSGEYINTGNRPVTGSANIVLSSEEQQTQKIFRQDTVLTGVIPDKDILISGCTVTIPGDFLQNHDVHIEGDGALVVQGNYNQKSGSLTVDGMLTIEGDFHAAEGSLTGTGTMSLEGDLNQQGNTSLKIHRLLFNGKTAQILSGNAVEAEEVEIENESRRGIVLETELIVSQSMKGQEHITYPEHLNWQGGTTQS